MFEENNHYDRNHRVHDREWEMMIDWLHEESCEGGIHCLSIDHNNLDQSELDL